jgi:hypothetical protein
VVFPRPKFRNRYVTVSFLFFFPTCTYTKLFHIFLTTSFKMVHREDYYSYFSYYWILLLQE